MGYASFGYQPEKGWYAGSDIRYMSDIMANDENTAKAPSWTVVGLTTGYKWSYGKMDMDCLAASITCSTAATRARLSLTNPTAATTNRRRAVITVSV